MSPFIIAMVQYVFLIIAMTFSGDSDKSILLFLSAVIMNASGLIIWQIERDKRD